MTTYRALVLVAALGCLSLGRVDGDDRKLQKSDDENEKERARREAEELARPILRLEIVSKPDVVKTDLRKEKLIGDRIYIRYQKRIYYIDRKTREKIFVGGGPCLDLAWDIGTPEFMGDPYDLKSKENKRQSEPIMMIQVGSIVSGRFIGGDPKKKYILVDGKGRLAERWKETDADKAISINFSCYYSDHAEPRTETVVFDN